MVYVMEVDEQLFYRWCGYVCFFFFFSSRRRHTRLQGDWSSDVCSSDLLKKEVHAKRIPLPVQIDRTHDFAGMLVEGDLRFEGLGLRREITGLDEGHEIGRASCRERV